MDESGDKKVINIQREENEETKSKPQEHQSWLKSSKRALTTNATMLRLNRKIPIENDKFCLIYQSDLAVGFADDRSNN